MFRYSIYVVLLFSLNKILSSSLLLLNSRGKSYASMCIDSTGDVLKAPVYLLICFLSVLSSIFSLSGEGALHSWQS